MIEWLAEQVVNGTRNINGQPTTYKIAITFLKDVTNPELLDEQIKKLNDLLIAFGKSELIKEE